MSVATMMTTTAETTATATASVSAVTTTTTTATSATTTGGDDGGGGDSEGGGHIQQSTQSGKRTKRMYCSICEKFNHNTKDCYKKQVEGVSGDINFDLGAQIGEKSDEHAEAPV
jgi:hypothetical protein